MLRADGQTLYIDMVDRESKRQTRASQSIRFSTFCPIHLFLQNLRPDLTRYVAAGSPAAEQQAIFHNDQRDFGCRLE